MPSYEVSATTVAILALAHPPHNVIMGLRGELNKMLQNAVIQPAGPGCGDGRR
jgi:hypothetical protein